MSSPPRTPDAAVRLVVTDLRRAVSCVTDAVLIAGRIQGEDRFSVTFGGRSGRAKVNRRRIWIAVQTEIEPREDEEVDGGWRMHTLRYSYAAFGDDHGSDEWLTYHYHPLSGVTVPHLHLNADADWASKGLRRRHLPTGRVSIEDFVQMLVEEFGVGPRRPGWKRDLDRNRKRLGPTSES